MVAVCQKDSMVEKGDLPVHGYGKLQDILIPYTVTVAVYCCDVISERIETLSEPFTVSGCYVTGYEQVCCLFSLVSVQSSCECGCTAVYVRNDHDAGTVFSLHGSIVEIQRF